MTTDSMFNRKAQKTIGPLLLLLSFSFLPFLLQGQSLKRFSYTHPQMGTRFRIVLYAESENKAQHASELAFSHLDSLNQRLSDYIPESELNRLGRQSGTKKKLVVSKELWQILRQSKQLSKKSKGAFDVTIGPLSKLWRKAFKAREFPSAAAVLAAKKRVNYRYLKPSRSEHSVRLKKANMQLDLGGIAKGYAADEMMKILAQEGITSALIDAGGDILLSGPPPEKDGWTIRIQDGETSKPLLLHHCAIATSGDTYQFLSWEGKKYSHIIDPRTGYGLTHRLQITVIAPTGSLADGLASTLSVLGPKKGQGWVKRFKDCSVTFVAQ